MNQNTNLMMHKFKYLISFQLVGCILLDKPDAEQQPVQTFGFLRNLQM